MKLLYHLLNQKGRSLLDEHISGLIKDECIKIACPYISISYFENVIIKLSLNFSLLTDVNALIDSVNNKNKLYDIYNMLWKFKDRIKYCPNLHSKVRISQHKIFLGSANLTDAAITRNNEMSMLIDTKNEIREINNWFDIWRNESKYLTELDFNNINKYIQNKNNSIISTKIIQSNSSINCHYDLYANKDKQIIDQKDEEYLFKRTSKNYIKI